MKRSASCSPFIVLCLVSVDGTAQAIPPAKPAESSTLLSARYQYRHQPSGTLLDEADILLGEHGMRIDQRIDGSANSFIVNYTSSTAWLLDRRRRLLHTIPLKPEPVDVSTDASADVSLDVSPDVSTSSHMVPVGIPGFIQSTPCNGLEAQQDATQLWHGRLVQRWSCFLHEELLEEQWYASSLGLVVRSLDTNGFISELTEIRSQPMQAGQFRPPSHFQSVSLESLMDPALPIAVYVEPSNSMQ